MIRHDRWIPLVGRLGLEPRTNVGGLASSTLLTLFVLPVLYATFPGREPGAGGDPRSVDGPGAPAPVSRARRARVRLRVAAVSDEQGSSERTQERGPSSTTRAPRTAIPAPSRSQRSGTIPSTPRSHTSDEAM